MREFSTLEQLRALVGAEPVCSPWFQVGQERIDTFADATDDHQWIHTDPVRCRDESPFGATVAHGFLTLSLLPAMFESAIRMTGVRMLLNYGLDKVRFPAPVPVGSRVRARIVLAGIEEIEGGAQLAWDVTVEREGGDRPVCVARFLVRRYV